MCPILPHHVDDAYITQLTTGQILHLFGYKCCSSLQVIIICQLTATTTLEGLPFPTRNDVEVQVFDGLACCPAARLHNNYTIRLQGLARRVATC